MELNKQKRSRKQQRIDQKNHMSKMASNNPPASAARQMIHKAFQSYSTADTDIEVGAAE